jgi:hypothetical protein
MPVTTATYGVTAASETRLKKLIESVVTDGQVDWEESEWRPVDANDPGDRQTSGKEEVWFTSGRLLFGPEQEENQI